MEINCNSFMEKVKNCFSSLELIFAKALSSNLHFFLLSRQKCVTVGKWLLLSLTCKKQLLPFVFEVQRICIDGFVTKVKSIPYCQMVWPTSELMMHLAFNTLVTERTIMNLPDLNFRAWTCKSMAWKSHLQGCQSATLALFLLAEKTALFSCLKLFSVDLGVYQ